MRLMCFALFPSSRIFSRSVAHSTALSLDYRGACFAVAGLLCASSGVSCAIILPFASKAVIVVARSFMPNESRSLLHTDAVQRRDSARSLLFWIRAFSPRHATWLQYKQQRDEFDFESPNALRTFGGNDDLNGCGAYFWSQTVGQSIALLDCVPALLAGQIVAVD